MLTYWLKEEDTNIREERMRTSDDSGVHWEYQADKLTESTGCLKTLTDESPRVVPEDSPKTLGDISLTPCVRSSAIFEHHGDLVQEATCAQRQKSEKRQRDNSLEKTSEGIQQGEIVTKVFRERADDKTTRVITVSEYRPETQKADVKYVNGLARFVQERPPVDPFSANPKVTQSFGMIGFGGNAGGGDCGSGSGSGETTNPNTMNESSVTKRFSLRRNRSNIELHPLLRLQAENAHLAQSERRGSLTRVSEEVMPVKQTVTFSVDAIL